MAEEIGMSDAVQSELAYMRDVIGLVAFAVEARRVLQEIDAVADGIPHIGDTLRQTIDTRCQWAEYPNTAAAVLESLHARLNAILQGGAA